MSSTRKTLQHISSATKLPGVVDVAIFGGGLHVVVDHPEATMERIRGKLAELGIEVRRLEQIPPSLEDVFVALIEAEERKAA